MRASRAALLVAAGLCVPALARACAVCGAGEDPNRSSFFGTTVLLSLLPLAMFAGGIAYVLRRVSREWLREEFAEREARPAAGEAPAAGTR